MLDLHSVHAYYGSSHVLHGVDLHVPQGEGVCLVGRNGAGKSSLLRSVVGHVRRVDGDVRFCGEQLVGQRAYDVARLGIGYVPEDRRIFPDLSVSENLRMGRYAAQGREPLSVQEALELVPLLKPLRNRSGGALSGGEQQALSIARALVGRPSLLLLDEPSEGLAPLIVAQLADMLQSLREQRGIAILLAEQNIGFAMNLTDYVYVIDTGRIVYNGTTAEFREKKELQKKYLSVG